LGSLGTFLLMTLKPTCDARSVVLVLVLVLEATPVSAGRPAHRPAPGDGLAKTMSRTVSPSFKAKDQLFGRTRPAQRS
jgi:hypothetical protein